MTPGRERVGGTPSRRTAGRTERVDLRGRPERRVRRAWRRGPGPLLRAAGLLYGLAADARDALWEAGVPAQVRARIPVVSVGGLTVGGTGKTPLASELARRLVPAGPTGVVTHGYPDEMAVHRALYPAAVVTGHRDRVRAVEAAADAGAELAVLDSGFQHRRLWRDADVVAVSADGAGTPPLRLPAGPYRERWAALGRADAVVVTRRAAPAPAARRLADRVGRALPDVPVARAALSPGPLRAANPAARRAGRPRPAVAVASIMYPDVFLRQLRDRGLAPEAAFLLPDHGRPDAADAERIADAAGARGVVGTLKDAVDLPDALPPDTPVWYVEDRLEWEEGGEALLGRLRELAGPGPGEHATRDDGTEGR